MPAMAMPLPPPVPSASVLATWLYPMAPKMIASAPGTNRKHVGSAMIPSTRDATHHGLFPPAASSVVPSMVNGMPQPLQLLALIELGLEQRGQTIDCAPLGLRTMR